MKLKAFFYLIIFSIMFCSSGVGIDIISSRLNISIPKSQVIYSLEVVSRDNTLRFVLNKNISTIKVNGTLTKFRKVVDNDVFLYLVEIPKDEKIEITISYYYDLLSECRNRGFILLSEVMRSLPYILDDGKNLGGPVYVSVEVDIQDSDFSVFSDGKVFSGNRTITFQKRYDSVLVLGYFDVFNINGYQISLVVPKNNESVALNIINSIVSIREVITTKYGIQFPKNLNIIYYRKASFSESIKNTIIISSFSYFGENYFSNIESLENFVSLVHEILHSIFNKNISEDIIDIFEGLIQYISIDVLSKALGQDSVKDTIFNNYISQVRYSSLYKNSFEVIRYRKYPLIFRYISSVVGEVSLVSFFKYIIGLDKDITLDIFKESFRSVVGANFDTFLPLFDGIPVLWNLDMAVSDKSIKIFSTAPIKVNTSVLVETLDYITNIIVEIQKDSSIVLSFDSEILKVNLNPSKLFPELFYYDNRFGISYPQVVEEIIKELQYLVNTEDMSRVNRRKILPSKSVRDKVLKFLLEKRKIFPTSEVKIGIESITRYYNQIVVEVIFYSSSAYRQGFVIINYGKSYYISDFGVVM